MKNRTYSPIAILFLVMTISLVSCQDETYMKYTANAPVYMSFDSLRVAIKSAEVQPLKKPGKIYFKDNYIYINEYMKGVHVYDNSDPANPKPIAFIEIPGNLDIAIRDNFLFADSYIDLVVIDISDAHNPKEIDREKDIFEYLLPKYDEKYEVAQVDREKGVVVEWEIKEVKELVKHENYYPIYTDYNYEKNFTDAASNTGGAVSTSGASQFGVGGSMARFGQYKDYLLVLKNSWEVTTFNVDNTGKIDREGNWNIGWSIETMFLRGSTMFIGSQQGMFIYDISDLPSMKKLSQFMHFTSCDPVVADDTYAYVTLRTGGACGSGENVLQVINIANLTNPYLEKTYQLKNPNGLAIDGDLLFVCDGTAGLKVFDASNPKYSLPEISHFSEIHAYDVIPMGTVLFMVGDDGFYQYDYTDVMHISLLSKIGVEKTEE